MSYLTTISQINLGISNTQMKLNQSTHYMKGKLIGGFQKLFRFLRRFFSEKNTKLFLNNSLVYKKPDECEKIIGQLEELMSEGKYDQAVAFGAEKQQELASFPDIVRADFNVHYAKALIYTGETETGFELLEEIIAQMEGRRSPNELVVVQKLFRILARFLRGRRRNLILGRAHNHLGYAYWMELGYYGDALEEFSAALPYFCASGLEEELANTEDNMGRVYALSDQPKTALTYINYGLELRQKLGDEYRLALSLNSLAIALLRLEKPIDAYLRAKDALDIFQKLNKERGIGLACITVGRSLRQLGSSTSLSKAETYLKYAATIFKQSVREPIRLFEAYYELGCTFRDQAAKTYCYASDKPSPTHAICNAERYLREAIQLVEGKNAVLYKDSCEELAQIHFQRHQFDDATYWLVARSQASNSQYGRKNDTNTLILERGFAPMSL